MHEKDEVTASLIDCHFRIEPELRAIYRIIAEDEDAAGEPIKLLEVNAASVETGHVVLFPFRSAGDITYPSVVAEMTLAEMDAIRQRKLALPAG